MRLDRISIDLARMNGQPCVRNLRLTVRRVVELVALYPDRAELHRRSLMPPHLWMTAL